MLYNCPPISHITTCLILISQVSSLHTPLRRPSSWWQSLSTPPEPCPSHRFSPLCLWCSTLNHQLVAACITFKTTVPTYKAVNGTTPTHLRALVRPHAPARALRATTSAGRYRHPWEWAKVAQLSPNSSLSWRRYGGPTSLLTWGPQSQRPPASARDSRPTCSELTWTPLSLLSLLLCSYVLALTLIFCTQYFCTYLLCVLAIG